MSAATTVPLSEYLNTSYRPDCEYLEGELLERNAGQAEHSLLQGALYAWFYNRRRQFGITAYPEQRVQVKAARFRVPDISIVAGQGPATGILAEPPFLCIEILSPEDRLTEMKRRVDDYLAFGVRYVWVIDPRTKHATVYTGDGIQEVADGILRAQNPDLKVNLNALE